MSFVQELQRANLAELESSLNANAFHSLIIKYEEIINGIVYRSKNVVTGDLLEKCCLHASSLDSYSDQDFIATINNRYSFTSLVDRDFANCDTVVKINHGFWEHFAALYSSGSDWDRYRDVNLPLRNRQYLESDAMNVILYSWLMLLRENPDYSFASITSGVSRTNELIESATQNKNPDEASLFKPHTRGCIKGLIMYAETIGTSAEISQICVQDSFDINSSFERGGLIPSALSGLDADDVVLIVGPKWLGNVRIAKWQGTQAFLAISQHNVMNEWRATLAMLLEVIFSYIQQGRKVCIFFQGMVLGPVIGHSIITLLRDSAIPPRSVKFYDIGRLLDLALGSDHTKTGSPLPGGGFNCGNQLILSNPASSVFQEFTKQQTLFCG